MENFNISVFVMTISALVLGITVHEAAHAIVADRLGDTTPRSQGRVTLWPLAHLDPWGTILMIVSAVIGFGIGWGRPVQTDPRQYRINARLADSLVSIAGPLSNLLLAVLFALILRTGLLPDNDPFTVWARVIVLMNITLAIFNMLPIYPLDGSHLLANALPPNLADGYRKFMYQFGIYLFAIIVMSGKMDLLLGPARGTIFHLLVD